MRNNSSIHASSYPPGGGNPPGGYNPGEGFNPPPYQPGSYQPGGYQQGGYQPGPYPPVPQYGQYGELAGIGPRILAFLIDRFLVAPIIIVGYLLFFVFAIGGAATQTDTGASAGGVIGMFVLFATIGLALIVVLYNEIYLAGKNNGQTIGKKMLKIRVAKDDGTAFGYMDAFLRNVIGYWISSLICSLGFFWGLFDARNETWHDKIFHTHVVRA